MDRAYEGYETRNLATGVGLISAVPPKQNRKEPWNMIGRQQKKESDRTVLLADKAIQESFHSLRQAGHHFREFYLVCYDC
mgnify:CR=1 FL=1